jgi:hypothetical protein
VRVFILCNGYKMIGFADRCGEIYHLTLMIGRNRFVIEPLRDASSGDSFETFYDIYIYEEGR